MSHVLHMFKASGIEVDGSSPGLTRTSGSRIGTSLRESLERVVARIDSQSISSATTRE